jgi:uncharacterized membrane protein YedE/YeeE
MGSPLAKARWNPYLVGIGIGVLSWFAFVTADKALGVSTTFVRLAGMILSVIAPGHVEANAYYQSKGLAVDWQMALVVGLFLGALVASRLSGREEAERVPGLWRWRFGAGRAVRYVFAFIGGAVLLYGARIAGGCTSGHGISGGLQLPVSSWAWLIAMFASGIVFAFLLFGKEGKQHVGD